MLGLLRAWSWPEWKLHPWRHAMALFAVAVGVALGFAVHLINASALAEFGAAVRAVNGQPDLELRGPRDGFDEALYAKVVAHPQVAVASPVIELQTVALLAPRGDAAAASPARPALADPLRMPLAIVGLDPLAAGAITPSLLPRLADDRRDAQAADRAVLDPGLLYLNPAARERVGTQAREVALLFGPRRITLPIGGSVAAEGPPLAVIDIAGAQALFSKLGRLTRIDVRLQAGADRAAVLRELDVAAFGVRAADPDESALRVSNLSRAYRVNLTVLALVALFVGGFLVFSVLSVAVAQRLPQFALLGVLGLTARERQRLVLLEAMLLGVAGSLIGIALGTALAGAALRFLGGDLGAGMLPGLTPRLSFTPLAALLYGALGVAAAMAGAWQPAWSARAIAPAQALKGLGSGGGRALPSWVGPALLLLAGMLSLLPPIGDLPWAAYASVACLLVGGIACVPAGVAALLARVPANRRPGLWHGWPLGALALLAVERARDQRHAATIAVAGIVASAALAVSLTVMVGSFRSAVAQWLDDVLPADLYARSAPTSASADTLFVSPEQLAAAARLPGVARVEGARLVPLSLDPTRPAVTLLARPLQPDVRQRLPLVGTLLDAPPGAVPVYASEAVQALYGARPGSTLTLPLPDGRRIDGFVRGIWRDYARQHGAVAIDADAFIALTGDRRVNDLAVWLADGADVGAVQAGLRRAIGDSIEFATTVDLRATSLAIFDRSFAVTRWLQLVAIGIGLVGVAASFSAQVLARRREFGLLAHLGIRRREVLLVVAFEAAIWSVVGVVLGVALGVGVGAVLVFVVNPQSFHWTMPMEVPAARIATLAAAVLAAGTLSALLAARGGGGSDAVRAVREDW